MPSDEHGRRTSQEEGGLEAEAEALVRLFNEAAPDYSPELEWFAMSLDHETMDRSFVLEAEKYIDGDGLDALREAGRVVGYISTYEKPPDDELYCQINIPVKGNGLDAALEKELVDRGD